MTTADLMPDNHDHANPVLHDPPPPCPCGCNWFVGMCHGQRRAAA